MKSRFVLHQHRTGRRHFDLRILQDDLLRTWSLLQEPPKRAGERRLAIEREHLAAGAMQRRSIDEEAFGEGPVYVWDEGEVEIDPLSARRLSLVFYGRRLGGKYRLRQMLWYPGTHWLFEKEKDS